ncbi:hypothetical protein AAW30_01874 [Arcobacter porcinus]|uniref:PepSY-associated TM helix domain-containing protein n=1 Tax=Arcobacter porcinus TaxID=1935204 RepID=UPI000824330D|nr:PepSY-associated TM helix domain-containing protein [Arcobacter porcinus]OCL81575.1 hypothetical protein AAW30_01874 [Arcobacter porcinus]
MHKSIWFQIHWFLGFIFGVLLLIIGVSGAVLSYEKEILQAINKDTYFVKAKDNQVRLKEPEILKLFQKSNPEAKINNIYFSSKEDSSIRLNIVKEGERKGANIYLNPYTAEVLPEILGKDFFMFFFTLHRWLAFDGDYRTIGKNAVAIGTIVAILLTIGGIIVYWPRVKSNFLKSFTFSFKHKKRAFLSTMHSAIGMWVVPFFLLLCLTGLYWSYDWYRSAMFSVMQVEQTKRVPLTKEQQAEQKALQAQGINYENIEKVVNTFKENVSRDYKNAGLRVVPSTEGTYTITYLYEDAYHYRETNSMEINPLNQEIVEETKYDDKKLNEKMMSSMLPLHSGEFFGWFGQLAMFVSSALMALFVITGYMLYYDRWKKKKAKAQKLKSQN